jgi:hypothetical protein
VRSAFQVLNNIISSELRVYSITTSINLLNKRNVTSPMISIYERWQYSLVVEQGRLSDNLNFSLIKHFPTILKT